MLMHMTDAPITLTVKFANQKKQLARERDELSADDEFSDINEHEPAPAHDPIVAKLAW
jgi:hypothetical protein